MKTTKADRDRVDSVLFGMIARGASTDWCKQHLFDVHSDIYELEAKLKIAESALRVYADVPYGGEPNAADRALSEIAAIGSRRNE